MNNINEGNLYNVQQSVTKKEGFNASKVGLDEWKKEVRKEIMEKLRGYSPAQVDVIIKNTFGSEVI